MTTKQQPETEAPVSLLTRRQRREAERQAELAQAAAAQAAAEAAEHRAATALEAAQVAAERAAVREAEVVAQSDRQTDRDDADHAERPVVTTRRQVTALRRAAEAAEREAAAELAAAHAASEVAAQDAMALAASQAVDAGAANDAEAANEAESLNSSTMSAVVRGELSAGSRLAASLASTVGEQDEQAPTIFASRRDRRTAAHRSAEAAPRTISEVVDVSTASLTSTINAAASQRAAQERRAAQLRMQAARTAAAKRAERTGPKPISPSKRGAAFGLAAPSRQARRTTARFAGIGGMLLVGGLIAATSLPAQAFQSMFANQTASVIEYGDVQSIGAEGVQAEIAEADEFAVADAVQSNAFTAEELAQYQAIADSETAGDPYGGQPAFPQTWAALETSYTQTPFPGRSVPVGSPFAARWGTFHSGSDFNPGVGTPIQPIANGVVSHIEQGTGMGGYMVWIDHNIDGVYYQSWYAHMIAGSITVEVGDVVDINTVIGQVGSTGYSTGPHLHLEIKNSDVDSIDPEVFLATRDEVTAP